MFCRVAVPGRVAFVYCMTPESVTDILILHRPQIYDLKTNHIITVVVFTDSLSIILVHFFIVYISQCSVILLSYSIQQALHRLTCISFDIQVPYAPTFNSSSKSV